MTDEHEAPEFSGVTSATYRGCGCKEIEFTDGHKVFEPCLACALYQAGHALQQASLRIREQRERDAL